MMKFLDFIVVIAIFVIGILFLVKGFPSTVGGIK